MIVDRKILFSLLYFLIIIMKLQAIYKAPTVFYSQVYHVGQIMQSSSGTYTCTTPILQENVIRAGLVLFSHTKRGGFYTKFEASIDPPSATTTTFGFSFNIILPTSRWIKLGFLIVIIKAQTTQKYIDLIPFSWGPGTILDDNTASPRTVSNTLALSTVTIFTASTGLTIIPFTTAYKMMPPLSGSSPISTKLMQFQLKASFSSNNAVVQLTAGSETKIEGFQGLVIIINPSQVTIGVANNYYMAMLHHPFSMISGTLSLITVAPRYGTNFNSKCILGMSYIKYTGSDGVQYYYGNSTGQFYNRFVITTSSTQHIVQGAFLCFGNDTECGQGATHWDKLINDCFAPALCPLPVPLGWPYPNQCPNCTQIICKKCLVDNRQNCQQCDQNSTLSGGVCSCNSGYYPVNMTISTSAQGLWNGVTQSLHKCVRNCTISLPYCKFDKCTNSTYCTQCELNYFLTPISLTQQKCFSCSQIAPNCTQCMGSPPVCINCDLYYGLTTLGQCQRCHTLIGLGCLTCEVSTTCLSCNLTFGLYNGLCYKCNQKIYKCNLCTINLMGNALCSQCQTTYYLGSNLCKSCLNLFNYCSECSSIQCFKCLPPYLIGTDGRCSQCIDGYWMSSGICMNIPGCKSSIISPEGTQICLACASQLNFVFQTENKKCVCDRGFKQNGLLGPNMVCIPVCGDGVVSISYQECDDKNLQNKDGCNYQCKVQKDFICTIEDPSKCVLYFNLDKFSFNYVSRVLGQNKGIFSFSIEPLHESFQKHEWSKLIKFNFSSTAVDLSTLQFSYSATSGQIFITVPYSQELENTYLQTYLILDPQMVVSDPQSFQLINKLNGINAPLVFEQQIILQTYQNVDTITFVMVIIMFLQFYMGSYFHKMIGLQTIQVFQSIYFVRMIANSASTSLLTSMNLIQFSATGYENAQICYNSLQQVYRHLQGVMVSKFTSINMKPFYLMNINIFLLPVFLAIIGYVVSLRKKYYSRNVYMTSQQQVDKDRYRDQRRSALWFYNHFFFPYVMMFNLFSFFFSIQELSKKRQINQNFEKFKDQSFSVHLIITFTTLAIYCYEIFVSLEEYKKFKMTPQQRQKAPVSIVQKLEHDQNNPDQANYHPAYILVYLVYYLLLSLGMILSVLINDFRYSLQLTMGLSIGYFILILIWQPYHSSIYLHNHFLKLYYATFVMFLVICYLFSKAGRLSNRLYVGLIYVVMVLVGAILIIGFVRIYIQNLFRKKLQKDSAILEWDPKDQKLDQQNKNNGPYVFNNPYILQNQLKEMSKKHDYGHDQKLNFDPTKHQDLSNQHKKYLIKKIHQDIRLKRQNIILQDFVDSYLPSIQNSQYLKLKTKKINRLFGNQNKSQSPLSKNKKINMVEKKRPLFEQEDQDQLRNIKRNLRGQFSILQ